MAQRTRLVLQGDAVRPAFEDQAFDLTAMVTSLEYLVDPLGALSEALRVARQRVLLGVINIESWLGRRTRRQWVSPWNSARVFTADVLAREGACDRPISDLFWQTTLWIRIPWSLSFRRGGFIGMGIKS